MNQYIFFLDWLANNSSRIESLINNGQSNSVAELISNELDRISPDISWEIGANKNGEIELTISAQGDKSLGKLLDELFVDCPSIPKWKLYRYKQPKSFSTLSRLIDAQGYHLEVENIKVQIALNSSRTKVDIELASPDFSQVPSDRLLGLTFFVLDGVLGEQITEEWIGKINVDVAGSESAGLLLSDLPKFMKELIEEL